LFGQCGGPSAIKALDAVTTRNGRRIAMLMGEDVGKLERGTELLDVIGKYGNRAAEFIWEHKGALAVGTVLAAFLADPEAFLNGTKELVKAAGETAVKPLAEGVARGTNWTPVVLLALVALIGFGVLLAHRHGWLTRLIEEVKGTVPGGGKSADPAPVERSTSALEGADKGTKVAASKPADSVSVANSHKRD
jgi:hypothetical protein